MLPEGNGGEQRMVLRLNVPVLREFLAKKNWTERDLAERMGVSYTTVYRALRGKRGVGTSFVAKLLEVTDSELAFEDLFCRDGLLPVGNEEKKSVNFHRPKRLDYRRRGSSDRPTR